MEDVVIRIAREALLLVLIISAPPLFIALITGLIVSLFQAVTQLQEQTMAFVPKIIAVFLILMGLLPWMIAKTVEFSRMIFIEISVWFG